MKNIEGIKKTIEIYTQTEINNSVVKRLHAIKKDYKQFIKEYEKAIGVVSWSLIEDYTRKHFTKEELTYIGTFNYIIREYQDVVDMCNKRIKSITYKQLKQGDLK